MHVFLLHFCSPAITHALVCEELSIKYILHLRVALQHNKFKFPTLTHDVSDVIIYFKNCIQLSSFSSERASLLQKRFGFWNHKHGQVFIDMICYTETYVMYFHTKELHGQKKTITKNERVISKKQILAWKKAMLLEVWIWVSFSSYK